MKVHSYCSSSGRDLIKEYINSLTVQERVDAYHVLECLENDQMDMVESKVWQDKILELYFYKHNRIFYVAADGTNIYLLHACRKQKNKTQRQDAKIVIARAKELSQQLGKKFVR